MSDLVVVCFDDEEGRTAGDSAMDIMTTLPYREGMTVADLQAEYPTTLMKKWEEDWDDIEEFKDEYGINVTGGWVVDKKIHTILVNGDFDAGSDSALYRMIHHVKTQIQSAAEMTIE